MLTVEEAAALLRIGRTKAYAMTREWRKTQGQSGLPVMDFGSVLRVPRAALEEMIGVPLGSLGPRDHVSSGASAPVLVSEDDPPTPIRAAGAASTARRRKGSASGQQGLFGRQA
ncbi:MAG: helix-turn-helix domain-containing protein [Acidimicrobiales bacterium]